MWYSTDSSVYKIKSEPTTAHEIRPPTRALHARYTLCLVAPVAKQPTNRIISPKAPMLAPTTTNISCTASSLKE